MNRLIVAVRDVLTLDTSIFERMRDAQDGIRRALLIITIISLIVAFPTFINELLRGLSPLNGSRAQANLETTLGPFEDAFGPFLGSFQAGLNIGAEIEMLPTRLPRPLANTLRALGEYLSYPFAWIGGWLSYLIWVMLAAKLMGGRAGIRQMVSTTSLHSVPMVLNVLGFIPCLGFLVQVATFVWGFIIYVKATAVANDFDWPRAALAVLLPFIAFGFVIAVAVTGLFNVLAIGFIHG